MEDSRAAFQVDTGFESSLICFGIMRSSMVFNTTENWHNVFLSVESAGHQNGNEGLFLLSNNVVYLRG